MMQRVVHSNPYGELSDSDSSDDGDMAMQPKPSLAKSLQGHGLGAIAEEESKRTSPNAPTPKSDADASQLVANNNAEWHQPQASSSSSNACPDAEILHPGTANRAGWVPCEPGCCNCMSEAFRPSVRIEFSMLAIVAAGGFIAIFAEVGKLFGSNEPSDTSTTEQSWRVKGSESPLYSAADSFVVLVGMLSSAFILCVACATVMRILTYHTKSALAIADLLLRVVGEPDRVLALQLAHKAVSEH